MEKRTMTAATVVSTSCTQNVIHPYRRQALAAFFRFCRATSDTTSSSARSAAAESAGDAALATVEGPAAAGRAQALLLLLPTPLLPRMLLLLAPLVLGAEGRRGALIPAPGASCDTTRRGRRWTPPCGPPNARHPDLGRVSISEFFGCAEI